MWRSCPSNSQYVNQYQRPKNLSNFNENQLIDPYERLSISNEFHGNLRIDRQAVVQTFRNKTTFPLHFLPIIKTRRFYLLKQDFANPEVRRNCKEKEDNLTVLNAVILFLILSFLQFIDRPYSTKMQLLIIGDLGGSALKIFSGLFSSSIQKFAFRWIEKARKLQLNLQCFVRPTSCLDFFKVKFYKSRLMFRNLYISVSTLAASEYFEMKHAQRKAKKQIICNICTFNSLCA